MIIIPKNKFSKKFDNKNFFMLNLLLFLIEAQKKQIIAASNKQGLNETAKAIIKIELIIIKKLNFDFCEYCKNIQIEMANKLDDNVFIWNRALGV